MKVFPRPVITALVLHCAALGTACAGEVREWTVPPGKPFPAELIAADGLRAVLRAPTGGKAIIPLAQLSPADLEYIRAWRAQNRRAPFIDPEHLAPWPAQAAAENLEVRFIGGDAATRFRYESAHYAVESDLQLPVPVVGEITAVLEATRAAVIALPLGLHLGQDTEKYPVALFAQTADYLKAGGTTGSGGTFDGATGRMLILLPNLGFKPGSQNVGGLGFQRQLFILKHEVTHQLLGRWRVSLPVWFDEGFCETLAAIPYTQGRYHFQNLDTALHDYLLKWRPGPDRRDISFIPPARLMALNGPQWRAEVAAGSAYALYDSAALLAYYFLHYDGKGDSAGVAAYLDALRRGVPPAEAEARHLLRDRTRENLASELAILARKLGLLLKPVP